MKDEEIISLLQTEGAQEKAFGLIISSYSSRLYQVIRKIVINHDDTDDILQDTFIKIWKNLDKFREDSALYTWLYRIATNEALSFLRKRKKAMNISMDENPELMNYLEGPSQSAHVSGDAIALKLQKAVLQLPEKQRLVFNFKYYENLKYEDIAEITGTSVGGLKATYHAAVKRIEEILGKQF